MTQKIFNGWLESPLFKFVIAPLMVASISGLIVLYGAVAKIESRMDTATKRRDEQFQQIFHKLEKIETCMGIHLQDMEKHYPHALRERDK